MKKAKSLPKLKAECQEWFNQFIRLRDKDKPCISCNTPHLNKQAGHFYAVKGYDGLRFDEINVNGECPGCNIFDESHLIGYGENLINRVGVLEYDLLRLRARDYKMKGYKFSRTELEGKIIYYKAMVKEFENNQSTFE